MKRTTRRKHNISVKRGTFPTKEFVEFMKETLEPLEYKILKDVVFIDDVKAAVEYLKEQLKNKKICCVHNAGDDPEPCNHTIKEVLKIIDEAFPDLK